MKFRKVMSALLAAMLVLSLAVPAFATEITGVDGLTEGAEVEITGETQTANIKITVPTSGKVILNPYELDYTVESNTVNDQVISATQYIKNESNMGIKVGGTVTGTLEGAEFATSTAVGETDKKVFLEFALDPVADDTTPLPGTNKVILDGTAQALTEITLDKTGDTNPCAAFGFSGDASKNPTNPWTADDIVGATIAFTFALDNSGAGGGGGGGSTTYSVTKGTLTGNDNGGDITIDKATAAAGDTVTVTVTPDSTNTNVIVTVTDADSGSVAVSGSGPYTFTMPAKNVTVTATFTS